MKLFFLSVFLLLPFLSRSAPLPEGKTLPRIRVPFTEEKVSLRDTPESPVWKKAARLHLEIAADGMQKHSLWNDRETILFLTYDENNLYLMAICKDENDQPAGKKHDDELHRGDAIEIFIDGIGDHKQYLEIQINSRNLVRDVNYLFTGNAVELDHNGIIRDGRNQWDVPGFDIPDFQHQTSPILSSGGKKTGWCVKAVLPAKLLLRRNGQSRFAKGMVLRANFVRLKHEGNAMHSLFWSPTVYGRPHRSPGRMGFLILD